MEEIIPVGIVLLIGATLLLLQQRGFSRAESRLLGASFAAHVVSAFAQVWITRYVYGWGDMFNYYRHGLDLSAAMRFGFSSFAPEVLNLVLHREAAIPFYVMGSGSSTGTMSGICGGLLFLLNDSLYATCLVIAIAAYFGKVALYRAFRSIFPQPLHTRLLIAATLVPSVVFWSSGILKESVAIAALGWMVLSLYRLSTGQRWQIVVFVLSTVTVALVKAYILFAFVIAAAVWFYWRRATSASRVFRLKPLYFVLGTVGAVAGVVALGRIFPQYAVEKLGEETARYQGLGATVGGGSYYEMGDASERSLAGQLAFAPFALLSSLFRPFIFEIRNAQMAINAMETTVLTWLLARAFVRRSARWMLSTLSSSPHLMFCLAFTATLGVAVGLATTNLGTLSRYRMPLVPFFAVLVFIWTAPSTNAVDSGPALRRRRAHRLA